MLMEAILYIMLYNNFELIRFVEHYYSLLSTNSNNGILVRRNTALYQLGLEVILTKCVQNTRN